MTMQKIFKDTKKKQIKLNLKILIEQIQSQSDEESKMYWLSADGHYSLWQN